MRRMPPPAGGPDPPAHSARPPPHPASGRPITRASPLDEVPMPERRVGLWLIGALGGVASTAALGLAALRRGLIDPTGMVTGLPLFAGLDLDGPDRFVLGGH